MKITYDPQADVLYLELRDTDHRHGREVEPGVVLSYDDQNAVVAIEILDASTRIDGAPLDVRLEYLAPERPAATR